jgi:RNA polymerase sigma-70 factor (ECF subfamily)
MLDDDSFACFLTRVRAGDEQAAAELVRQYEAEIRREVRLRLGDSRFRRVFDSMDICQSVLGSFFVRVAAGQYEFEKPADLLRLLVTMARTKLAWQVRRARAQRRDYRRQEVCPADLETVAADPSPSEQIEWQELLREFRLRLSKDERQLADLRAEGRAWDQIAATLGGTPEGRRKQLTRAIDRVARQLGLDEGSYA